MQLPSLLNSNFFWKTLPRIIFLKFIEISLFDLPFYLNPPLFPRTKNDGRRTHCVCICVCVALKQPCPTGGNGGIVSTNSPLAGFRPPMFRLLSALQIALRISKVAEAGVGSRWPTHLDPTLFRTIVSCSS